MAQLRDSPSSNKKEILHAITYSYYGDGALYGAVGRMTNEAEELRAKILRLVRDYYAARFPKVDFVPGRSRVPCTGRVFDSDELVHLTEAALDFWLTAGRFAEIFEREIARFFGLQYASLVNSGSSANLLALSCLTSPKLGTRRLRPGDEIITVATGFPTTLNPIVQTRLVPVFVDVSIPTYNVDVGQLEDAYSERTRAVILAHTLGNPFDVDAVMEFIRRPAGRSMRLKICDRHRISSERGNQGLEREGDYPLRRNGNAAT